MKKTLLTLAFVCAAWLHADAQTICFQKSGVAIVDGSEVVFDPVVNPITQKKSYETVGLSILSLDKEEDMTCTLSLESDFNGLSGSEGICTGSNCYGINADHTWSGRVSLPAGSFETVKYDFVPADASASGVVKVKFTVVGAGESHSFTAVFNVGESSGINGIRSTERVSVYNATGKLVKANITASSVYSLPTGFYFVKSAKGVTRKVTVRK
ncbi:MAG: T9SS type A sorting domain-containing protein [Prevotella sp.]